MIIFGASVVMRENLSTQKSIRFKINSFSQSKIYPNRKF